VIAPDGGVILDFDKPEVYELFCKRWPELAASYTESTPRGGKHIFLRTSENIPRGLVLVPGIEVKQIVLVYPSKIGGKGYSVAVPGEVLRGNVLEALQPFLVPGGKYPPSPVAPVLGHPGGKLGHQNGESGFLAELKQRWPILAYLQYFEPKLLLTGRGGRWYSGRCPWHEDHKPSLWIDAERGLWGCHGCGARGDIINWHARRLNTTDFGKAIRDLAEYQLEVRL
jgi:hypothetical protein